MKTLNDRSRGCLIGGAIGDALGWPVEFMRLDEIKRKFGPQHFHLLRFKISN